MVEAEIGSLLDFLPVPLLVTSESGEVVRANTAAGILLGAFDTLIGRRVDDVLRGRAISVRVRTLSHSVQVLRLYVLQGESQRTLFCKQ